MMRTAEFRRFRGDGGHRRGPARRRRRSHPEPVRRPRPRSPIAPGTVTFAPQRVGTVIRTEAITVANTGSVPLSLSSIVYRGGNKNDFIVGTDCFPSGHPATLAANSSCLIDVSFYPQGLGRRTASLTITDSAPTSPQIETLKGTGTEGYYIPGQRGGVAVVR